MTARPFRWVGQAEAQDLVDLSNRPIQILPPDSDDDDDDSDDFDRRNIRLGESHPAGGSRLVNSTKYWLLPPPGRFCRVRAEVFHDFSHWGENLPASRRKNVTLTPIPSQSLPSTPLFRCHTSACWSEGV